MSQSSCSIEDDVSSSTNDNRQHQKVPAATASINDLSLYSGHCGGMMSDDYSSSSILPIESSVNGRKVSKQIQSQFINELNQKNNLHGQNFSSSFTDFRANSMIFIEELAEVTLSPYRIIHNAETNETFVLCVTLLGDRVSVYYSPYETSERRHLFRQFQMDVVSGKVINTEEEAEEFGVKELANSTGVSAGSSEASLYGNILGVMSASVYKDGNPVYCSIIFEEEEIGDSVLPPHHSSGARGGDHKKNHNSSKQQERGIPKFSILTNKVFNSFQKFLLSEQKEEMRRLDSKNFVRSQGVAPIVGLRTISNMRKNPEELTKLLRYTTAAIEKQHFAFTGKEIIKNSKRLSTILNDKMGIIASFAETLGEAREQETRNLAIERFKLISPYIINSQAGGSTQQHQPLSTSVVAKCDEICSRLSELSNFSSRIEEILGEVSSKVEEYLDNATNEIQNAIAELFIETKLAVPNIKGKMSDSRTWGYSSYFNNVNCAFLGQKASQPGMTIDLLSQNPVSIAALEESPEIVFAAMKAFQTRSLSLPTR